MTSPTAACPILYLDAHGPLRDDRIRALAGRGLAVRAISLDGDAFARITQLRPAVLVAAGADDAIRVCARLKTDPEDNGTKILRLMGGAATAESDARADLYLREPVADEELLAAVSLLVRLSEAERDRERFARDVEDDRRRLQMQSALLDQARDAIFVRGMDRSILYWNRAAAELYGWTAEEAIGRNPHTLLGTRFPPGIPSIPAFEELLGREGRWEGELEHVRRDGSRVLVDSRQALIRDEAGPRAILEINRDITERVRLMDEAEHARADAERSSRLKDEFLATLSHELRTPLNAIVGWVQLLMGGRLDAETSRRALETVFRSAQLQTRLIEDVLDVSRIITGKLHLEMAEVDLVPVLEAALESIRPAAKAKGVTLGFEVEARRLIVQGDAGRLQQVFWNLLSNAVKFTPARGRVDVLLARSGTSIAVAVRDTGAGIDPAFLPRVFDRFSQFDSSSTRRHSGLGLGLAIVRHLVESHGGEVHAESPGEGKGATFVVRLPVRAVTQAATAANEVAKRVRQDRPRRRAAAPASASLDGARVLVVDDEPDARKLLEAVLSAQGARVESVASAREAIERVADRPPNLVISDIGMPEMDGYDLIRAIRRLPPGHGAEVPAVALTAYGRPEDRAHALDAGYQLHIPKPVKPDELLTAVASLLDGAS